MTTAPIPTAELERIIELGEKATSAPWRVLGKATGYINGRDDTGVRHEAEVTVAKVGAYSDKELLRFNRDRWDADGAFIAAARIAPALAAELIAARAAIARLIDPCGGKEDDIRVARRLLPSAAQETE